MPSIGPGEVLVCLVLALIVLGPEQLPKAARSAGRAMAQLKKFNAGVQAQLDDLMNVEDPAPSRPARIPETTEPVSNSEIPDTEGFHFIDERARRAKNAPPPATGETARQSQAQDERRED